MASSDPKLLFLTEQVCSKAILLDSFWVRYLLFLNSEQVLIILSFFGQDYWFNVLILSCVNPSPGCQHQVFIFFFHQKCSRLLGCSVPSEVVWSENVWSDGSVWCLTLLLEVPCFLTATRCLCSWKPEGDGARGNRGRILWCLEWAVQQEEVLCCPSEILVSVIIEVLEV